MKETRAERELRRDSERKAAWALADQPETKELFEIAHGEPNCNALEIKAYGVSVSFNSLPVPVAQKLFELLAQLRIERAIVDGMKRVEEGNPPGDRFVCHPPPIGPRRVLAPAPLLRCCGACGSSDVLDTSQSIDCNTCGKST